jgi:hypothetical protein
MRRGVKSSFTIRIDRSFTASIGRKFTNAFDLSAKTPATACVCCVRNVD